MASTITIVVTTTTARAVAGFRAIQAAARTMGTSVTGHFTRMRASIASAFTSIRTRAASTFSGVSSRLVGVRIVATSVFGAIRTAAVRTFGVIRTAATSVFAALQNLPDPVKNMAGAIGTLTAKVTAFAAVGIHILPTVIDLLGIIQLLPAAVFAAGAAFLTVKLATGGMGEAIQSALKDWNEFEKTTGKDMPRWAHDFVAAIVLIRNAWKPLRRDLQNRLFRELGADLMVLNAQYLPVFGRWLPKIADMMNAAIRQVMEWLKHSEQVDRIDAIMRNVAQATQNLLSTLMPLARIFLDIAEVGAPGLVTVTQAIAKMADAFAAFVDRAKNNGQLDAWLQRALDGFRELKGIVFDLGGVIAAMYRAATGDGGGFLQTLHEQTTALKEWADSTHGQQALHDMSEIGRAIVQMVVIVGQAFVGWLYILHAFYGGLNEIIRTIIRSFYDILRAMQTVMSHFGGPLAHSLDAAVAEFGSFADRVNGELGSINDVNVVATITKREVTEVISRISSRASGGMVTGLVKVAERGAEIIDTGARGARVYNAGQTRQMMAASARESRSVEVVGGYGNNAGPAAAALNTLMRYVLNGPLKLIDSNGKRVRAA